MFIVMLLGSAAVTATLTYTDICILLFASLLAIMKERTSCINLLYQIHTLKKIHEFNLLQIWAWNREFYKPNPEAEGWNTKPTFALHIPAAYTKHM